MKRHLIIGAGLIVAACGVHKNNVEELAVTETTPVVEEEIIEEIFTSERPHYNPTETILTDLVHTKLEVNFDWTQSRMNGVATITAKQHFYASNELVLDAKGMVVNSVKMGTGTLAHKYEEDVLTIDLGKEYKRGEEYTVVIDYVARPDEREEGGSAAITSDKGLYFINPRGEQNASNLDTRRNGIKFCLVPNHRFSKCKNYTRDFYHCSR